MSRGSRGRNLALRGREVAAGYSELHCAPHQILLGCGKSRGVRWLETVSCWGIKGNTKAFSWGNMKERGHLEELDVDLRKILKKDFRWDRRVDWIYVTQDRDKCPDVVNT
jgi:hypothetical protein